MFECALYQGENKSLGQTSPNMLFFRVNIQACKQMLPVMIQSRQSSYYLSRLTVKTGPKNTMS